MQDLSFRFQTPEIDLFGLRCQVYVHTFENVYAPEGASVEMPDEAHIAVSCPRLVWAGGQEAAASGGLALRARREPGRICVGISVQDMPHPIRCVRLVIHGLPPGRVANKLDLTRPEVDENGLNLRYPEGWRTLDTPMLLLEHESGFTCLRSLDARMREKRFVLVREGDAIRAELIFEEAATRMDVSLEAPEWEISHPASLEEAYRIQTEHIRAAYSLEPWETRKDVPEWAREISLVAAIHGQHWCGYIMNDYAAMSDAIRWLAERIEGKRILAYLPGWEGRYYWQYGDYHADSRMGGPEALRRLVREAHSLGVHLMPMFGINVVNCGLPNYEQWGAPSEFRTASGNQGGGSVDWDASRHFDHGSNRSLNPAAPGWQNRLVRQIHQAVDTYGFDAVFLDIAAVWYNDPSFELYGGILELVRRIREGHEQLLICGEGWYDALGAAFPVLQSGHTDGPMHYHDALYPPFFDTWCRNFAHLCLGDPSRGSTGVHELGTNRTEWKTPLRKGIWPTVTIVDGTLRHAPERIEEILKDAKEYARLYLG